MSVSFLSLSNIGTNTNNLRWDTPNFILGEDIKSSKVHVGEENMEEIMSLL